MEYVQERVTTLHDYGDADPVAPTERAAVVVPMTEREYAGLAPERTLSALEAVDPARVVVPLSASSERVADFHDWLDSFDLDVDLLWCSSPEVEDALAEHGLGGPAGKGRDVWLALGYAADAAEFVVCHDADAKTYSERHVPKLLAPLGDEYAFAKGYYARVENRQLYGRLFRLFVRPLVRALDDATDHAFVDYLGAFRYALAGEFAMDADLAREVRAQREFGLEVGTLADAYAHAGFERSAQVDLGRHEHDHRAVTGPTGLSDMSEQVGRALFNALADHGVDVDYTALRDAYRDTADALVDQYAADAAFNDFDYDAPGERDQVEAYAPAVRPPDRDDRLPAWHDVDLHPETILDASHRALQRVTD
ncbi:glycosyl transferase family 2 [Halorubellus sp. JP-L1]|uniref:glycosyl transferase family 2 n=1 Tax=Halorubellus sp. JP-L1 TaxID=2715753 RepID=UPI0014098C61|nr:glycosyl transferase family 2 [Halorubellus sp. JP-L1]NHN42277.1 glycosyl transferase family 2 [Halorubellus sp. JP-L1]